MIQKIQNYKDYWKIYYKWCYFVGMADKNQILLTEKL